MIIANERGGKQSKSNGKNYLQRLQKLNNFILLPLLSDHRLKEFGRWFIISVSYGIITIFESTFGLPKRLILYGNYIYFRQDEAEA